MLIILTILFKIYWFWTDYYIDSKIFPKRKCIGMAIKVVIGAKIRSESCIKMKGFGPFDFWKWKWKSTQNSFTFLAKDRIFIRCWIFLGFLLLLGQFLIHTFYITFFQLQNHFKSTNSLDDKLKIRTSLFKKC